MPASLSWAIILFLSPAFISYPSSLQTNGKLLGRGCPVISSPGTGWAPKGVLRKLATWPPDYTLSMRDDLLLKRGRKAAAWLRNTNRSLSQLCSHRSCASLLFCDPPTQLGGSVQTPCISPILCSALEMKCDTYFPLTIHVSYESTSQSISQVRYSLSSLRHTYII